MFKGITYALVANFIWGLIFIVPEFMKDYSPVEIAFGRYFVFGILSLIIFLQRRCVYPISIWLRAAGYSFVFTMGYYICVVMALKFSSPAICALILGLSPILIAFYGNFREKEISYRTLVLPTTLTLIGLVMINTPHLQNTSSTGTYIWGLVFGLLALLGWAWYVVANSRFLKNHPEVHAGDWATLIGATCLIWVALFALFFGLFLPEQFSLQKCFSWNLNYVVGSLILGVVCAWLGSYVWNKASYLLPVSLAGQLTIFETIFGVIFFYLLEMKIPPLLECLGIALFLGAIFYGVKQFTKAFPLMEGESSR